MPAFVTITLMFNSELFLGGEGAGGVMLVFGFFFPSGIFKKVVNTYLTDE